MYIHEAIKARTAEKPFIRRKAWTDSFWPLHGYEAKIYPTDSADCCIPTSELSRKPPRRWEPTLTDLAADDWEPAGESMGGIKVWGR